MTQPESLHLDARFSSDLSAPIDRWLEARKNAIAVTSSENQRAYNATLFELGAALAEWYPEGVATPGAFEWYRLSLIGAEEE